MKSRQYAWIFFSNTKVPGTLVKSRRGDEKMARLPRIYAERVLYYVTSKGGNNQHVFRVPQDYFEYIGLVSKYKEQYGFKLFAFALLPTHLHMLIELKNNIGVSNIMHDINSLYTKMFNSKYNSKGHLFEARFKTTLAEKGGNLLDLIRHIHLNPKREKIVYDPKDYPYSSHEKYLDESKRREPDMCSEIEETFKMLKGRETDFAAYVARITKKEQSEIKKRVHKKRVLGSKVFQERMKKMMKKRVYQTSAAMKLERVHGLYSKLAIVAVAGIALLVVFFSKQQAELITEYDKTLVVYDKTVTMLKQEQAKAVRANESAEEYAWKIRVAEKALEDLRQVKKVAIDSARKLDGYLWQIRMRQIGGPKGLFQDTDTIIFNAGRVGSANLKREGFQSSNYSKKILRDGKVTWETIQKNPKGDTASWRGEWDGKVMKGVLSKRSAKGIRRDFSFIATSVKIGR